MNKGIYTLISEGGKELSSEEKQTICLARAALQKSKIVVLVEPT
jgi:ABC-type multidrug transport system fused ATPase/permease subunit